MIENYTGEIVDELDNGKVVISYQLGKKNGPTRFIDIDGNVLSIIEYVDDEIDGKILQYYPGGAQLLAVLSYKKGTQHGEAISFFENGMTQTESEYVDGKLDGPFISYDDFGDKMMETSYKNGEKHGKSTFYYPKSQGGEVCELSFFKNGLIDGERVTFFPTGEISSRTKYCMGKAQEYTRNFDKNGREIR